MIDLSIYTISWKFKSDRILDHFTLQSWTTQVIPKMETVKIQLRAK